jgi:hypothetical protein
MKTDHLNEHRGNESFEHCRIGLQRTRAVCTIEANLWALHHISQRQAQS